MFGQGILVPRPGIEPVTLALGVWSLNHWTTRESMFLLLIQIFTFPGPSIRFGDKALLRIYEFLGSLCRKSQSLNLTPFLLPSVPPWLLPTTLRSGAGDEEACEARLSAPRLSGGKVSPLKNKLYPFTFQKSTLVFNIGKTYLRLKIQRIQRYRVQSLLPIPGSRHPGGNCGHQFLFWERDSWMMPPVSLGRCAVFRTVMRGFWKETCGVRQDVRRYKWERVWKERGSGPVATLALHGLFCYIPSPVEAPTTQLLSKAMAAIHWVLSLCPAPNCMPHGLIAPNSHQYWCFYHHRHLPSCRQGSRLGEGAWLAQGHTTARAQGREQTRQRAREPGPKARRWPEGTRAGQVGGGWRHSVAPLGRLKNAWTLPVVMNKSMHPLLFKTFSFILECSQLTLLL